MMKKLLIVFTFAFALCVVFPISANAETISDLRNKISKLQAEKAAENKKGQEVQSKIDSNKNKVNETTAKIEKAKKNQENTQKEIEQLDKDIAAKKEEIKDLIVFYQASENDNFYLKFILGAESFEDFIYRFSVAEQLTEANDNLVKEMNDLIKKNQQKIKELEAEKKELNQLNKELTAQIDKLGKDKRKINENALSVDEEISTVQKQIKYYKSKGCGENEDVDVCSRPTNYGVADSGSANLKPSAKGFILPLSYGYITSYYGGRIHPIFGTASYHSGVDIAANTGTTIMASNKGMVVGAGYYDGYGYAVMVYHGAAGYNYTTLYGHMSKISVSFGQAVSRGQKLGEVGSTGWSTGPHLHFQAMYGNGYNLNSTFDPFNLVYIPLSW